VICWHAAVRDQVVNGERVPTRRTRRSDNDQERAKETTKRCQKNDGEIGRIVCFPIPIPPLFVGRRDLREIQSVGFMGHYPGIS